MPQRSIHLLNRDRIDPDAWDAAIAASSHPRIYALSIYLDHMSPGWSALVQDDYQAVMPLPWRRKWGVPYLCQPAFAQQLGLFAVPGVEDDLQAFLRVAMSRFRFAEWQLTGVRFPSGAENFAGEARLTVSERPNFILDLSPGYGIIRSSYKPDLLRNLDKAASYGNEYAIYTDPVGAARLFRDQYAARLPAVRPRDYAQFEALVQRLDRDQRVCCRAVKNNKGELLAVALAFKWAGRIYLLQNTTLSAGRACSANHLLLDGLIREFAGQPLTLDFEGSALPGVAHFYQNFGAVTETYFLLRYNYLPWPLRLFK